MPEFDIDIIARFAKFSEALNQIRRDTERHAKSMESAFDRVGSALKKIGVGVSVTAFSRAVLAETGKLERSQAQLQATLTATGHAAGLTASELEELADKASKVTLFDDDDVRQAVIGLLHFRDIQGETFKAALDATLKLATAQGGTAAAAAETLGRALEDPIGGLKALKSFMPPLNSEQQKLIANFERTGDKAAAAKVVLDQVNRSLGAGGTGGISGAANSASKAYQNFLQTVGTSKAAQESASSFFRFLSQSLIDIDQIISARNLLDKLKGIALFTAGFRGFTLESAKPLPDQFKDLTEGAEKFIADQGKARQRMEQLAEAARKLAEENKLIAAATTKAGLEEELKSAQQSAEIASSALEDTYAHGLVSAKRYYAELTRLAEEQSAREIKAVDAAIRANNAKKADTPEEKASQASEAIRLDAERARIVEKLAGDKAKFDRQAINDGDALLNQITETNAALKEQAGDTAGAAALRREAQNRLLRAQLQANAPGNVAQLDQLEKAQAAHDQFTQALGESERGLADLGRAERAIQNEQARGALTTLDAMERVDAARRLEVERLRSEIPLLQEAAEKSKLPADVDALAEARQRLDDLAASANQVRDQLRHTFQDALVDPLIDVVNRAKTADQALKAFFSNVAASLLRLGAQDLSERLFGSLFKTGAGGLFGLFSSSGGVGTSEGVSIIHSAGGNVITPQGPMRLERFGAGGITRRPMLSLAGEAGPEAYVPLSDGRSIPVTLKGLDTSQLTPIVPPTLAQTQRGPKGLQSSAPAVVLQIHPDAMHMTLRDWFESELARTMATR